MSEMAARPETLFSLPGLAVSKALALDVTRRVQRAFDGATLHGAALYVTGGAARGDLCPGADVDLLLLVDDASDDAVSPFHQVVAALWDEGLSIAARVAPRAALFELAAEDHTFATSVLEALPLLPPTPDDAIERLRAHLLGPGRLALRAAKVAELIHRHQKSAARTGAVMEPDLKHDAGGVRDVHTVLWCAVLDATIPLPLSLGAGLEALFSSAAWAEPARVARAYERLLTARAALHRRAAGRGERVLREHQITLGEEMGFGGPAHAQAEAFLREMALAQRDIAHAALTFVDPVVHREERRYSSRVAGRLSAGPTASAERADERDNVVITLLRGEAPVASPFGALCDADVLGALFLDLHRLRGQVRLDGYHAYATDAHIARCADAALAAAAGSAPWPEPLLPLQYMNFDTATLVAAALFHDIGKGLVGDHSAAGVVIAERELLRLGVSPRLRDDVCWLVENHLLLSHTAQRRDLGDPAIIQALADAVGTKERLLLLALLTAVDVSSVAPRMLNEWKARLYRTAYDSVLRYWEDAAPVPRADDEAAVRARAHTVLKSRVEADLADAFVDGATVRGLSTRFDAALVGDARIFSAWRAAQHTVVRAKATPQGDATILRVAVPHLRFAPLCRVFARERVRILHAHVDHRKDGVGLVAFRVDDGLSCALGADVQERVVLDLRAAASDARAPAAAPLFHRKASDALIPAWARAAMDVDSWGGLVIDVGGPDRPGALAALTATIDASGYRTLWLKAATSGARLRDSFVLDGPRDAESVESLRSELLAVLESDVSASPEAQDATG